MREVRSLRPGPTVLPLIALAVLVSPLGRPLVAAPQAQARETVVAVSEETALLAQGWSALGAGDAVAAAARAQTVLGKYPQSVGGLALAVEAAIARAGAMSGLDTYESWLATRRLEHPYVVRRAAMALLREAMAKSTPRARLIALKALAAEGDAEALAKLADAVSRSQLAETKVLAELGDAKAVMAIIKAMEASPGTSKMTFIDALASSRSTLAIQPLVRLLDDRDIGVVAAAADAIGKIGAPEIMGRLRPMVDDTRPGPVRWAAARALARMGDGAGTQFLRSQLVAAPEIGDVSSREMLQVEAAEALSFLGPNPDWTDTARRLAGSRDPQVRMKAAQVMAPYDQALAKDALEALMFDQNPAIREQAGDVLASRVANDFATLRRLLRSGDSVTQTHAAARIAELTR